MRITIMTGDGSYGCSDISGEEDVEHALEIFSNAMVAAGFAKYNFIIDESCYEQRCKCEEQNDEDEKEPGYPFEE